MDVFGGHFNVRWLSKPKSVLLSSSKCGSNRSTDESDVQVRWSKAKMSFTQEFNAWSDPRALKPRRHAPRRWVTKNFRLDATMQTLAGRSGVSGVSVKQWTCTNHCEWHRCSECKRDRWDNFSSEGPWKLCWVPVWCGRCVFDVTSDLKEVLSVARLNSVLNDQSAGECYSPWKMWLQSKGLYSKWSILNMFDWGTWISEADLNQIVDASKRFNYWQRCPRGSSSMLKDWICSCSYEWRCNRSR